MRGALKPLVDAGWLEEQPTNAQEIRGLLGIMTRRLEELNGTLKYADSIYALAYDAVRCGATVVLRAEGVRAKRARHHEMTFEALHRLAIPALSDRARYYDGCRRKRVQLQYDSAGDVSDREAADLAAFHPYRRKWATERKHLPDVDVAAAGGWSDTFSLKQSYQQADDATMLKVVLGGELRERQA